MNEENEMKNTKKIKKSKHKSNFTLSEMIVLVIMTLLIGITLGDLLNKSNLVSDSNKTNDKYLNEFIKNYEYIVNNYYEDIDKSELINKAISGMTESLEDPYSVYFDSQTSSNFNITLDGSYQGIGIQIYKEEESGYIVVSNVFDNSPASKSGIQANDKIISLDGESVVNISATDFSEKVRNSEKTSFEFEILREKETIKITLNKDIVELSSVTSKIIESNGKKIGYIYIGIFAINSYRQFEDQLKELEKENINYLIIDVRSNTGGHLKTVDSILRIFLNSKQVMYQFDKNDKITKTYGSGKDNKKYNIVLLGNEASASASEVLIAGLKENLNSVFIGKKTYGKGTVQELVTLSNGTQYKITVKKWLTPKGNWVNDTEGIIPDIEVDYDIKHYETGLDEDDTQLQAAIDYINNNY